MVLYLPEKLRFSLKFCLARNSWVAWMKLKELILVAYRSILLKADKGFAHIFNNVPEYSGQRVSVKAEWSGGIGWKGTKEFVM